MEGASLFIIPSSNEMVLSEQNMDETKPDQVKFFHLLRSLGGKRLLYLVDTVPPVELLFNHPWVPPWVLALKPLEIGKPGSWLLAKSVFFYFFVVSIKIFDMILI